MEGPIKIGFTAASAVNRMAQLQTGHHEKMILLGTSPGEIADERAIHRELKDYQIQGEWFEQKPELIEIIKDIIYNQHKWYYFRQIKIYTLEVQCAALREQVADVREKLQKSEEKRQIDHEAMRREISELRKANAILKRKPVH
jgi:hypothetical protein